MKHSLYPRLNSVEKFSKLQYCSEGCEGSIDIHIHTYWKNDGNINCSDNFSLLNCIWSQRKTLIKSFEHSSFSN